MRDYVQTVRMGRLKMHEEIVRRHKKSLYRDKLFKFINIISSSLD